MRILLVAWEYPPLIEGGLGRHVFKLSEALADGGHDVHVLTRGDGGVGRLGVVGVGRSPDVRVHRVDIPPFSRDLDAFMTWVGQLNERLAARGEEVLAGERFDLIHSHDWMVAGAARRLAGRAGVPWLVTVHATEFGRHEGWIHTHPQYEIHTAERRMVRDADGVICCSEYMAGHVERVFGLGAGSVAVVPNGIDPADLSLAEGTDVGAARRHCGVAEDEPLVLLVGRLVHEKGFHVALEALAQLGEVAFVIAGTGPAEEELHAQAQTLGLLGRGRFLGRIDDELLHALYRSADVCVVPSLYEPFGLVPLEAMAAGCPVVVSDTGGLREVVRGWECAISCEPGDALDLARAVGEVLGDRDLSEEMRVTGAARAGAFDWAAVGAETGQLYARALAAREPLAV